MRNLIQNTQKLTVLDATLTIQNEHLPEIKAHMENDVKGNLHNLGSKLEQCLNSLPLGPTTMIEDPARLEEQTADYKCKLSQANGLMGMDKKQNDMI